MDGTWQVKKTRKITLRKDPCMANIFHYHDWGTGFCYTDRFNGNGLIFSLLSKARKFQDQVWYNKLLTNLACWSRTGKYQWPLVAALGPHCQDRANAPQYGPRARLVRGSYFLMKPKALGHVKFPWCVCFVRFGLILSTFYSQLFRSFEFFLVFYIYIYIFFYWSCSDISTSCETKKSVHRWPTLSNVTSSRRLKVNLRTRCKPSNFAYYRENSLRDAGGEGESIKRPPSTRSCQG